MRAEQLARLLDDGTIATSLSDCRTLLQLAERIGMTTDALSHGWRRLRTQRDVPMLLELLAGVAHLPGQQPAHAATTTAVPAAPGPQPRTIANDIRERSLKAQVDGYKAKCADLLAELASTNAKLDAVIGAGGARSHVQPIVPRERTSGMREATAVALASDWHVEERVSSEQVNGVNEYDLAIAQHRVERYFGGLAYLHGYHEGHFALRDMVLWLGGDLITGYLREENLESNELSPVQAIATLHAWLATGIRSLLDRCPLETLRIVCSSGNHGRLTDKVRASTREANSIEWLLYCMLAREFASEPRISFQLPQGQISYLEVYGRTVRFLHGDSIGYKGGVGGITIPLNKAIAGMDTVRTASLTCLGHFHQYFDLPHMVVNGSLIGYSPYSMSLAARFEEPRQAFFLLDSKRGKTMPSDIWVSESK